MEWTRDRDPKSKGLYAIQLKFLDNDPNGLGFAYFDGIGWKLPCQVGKELTPYRGRPLWSVIDWGNDKEEL